MTKWQEFPLRPQGQAWPGLNTRGGVLDPGSGQLEDGSFNQIINEADLLEKRKGMIRGLDERFEDVVCGLFAYTDDCGREFLLVADTESIKIRQPFVIPVFTQSDAYPIDDFEDTLSTESWRNTDDYETAGGALRLKSTTSPFSQPFVNDASYLQWFKDASNRSYFVLTQYALSTTVPVFQAVAVSIKRTGLSQHIVCTVSVDSALLYRARLELVTPGQRIQLAEQVLDGASDLTGFLTVQYDRSTRLASATINPQGGSTVVITGTLTELQDNDLGQGSALGLTYQSEPSPPLALRLFEVTGGPA